MASRPERIRVISDGRAGHENQSAGLAEAIARRAGSTVETVRLPSTPWLFTRCRAAVAATKGSPDLVIGAGHKVHLPLRYAARTFRAKSVVIMKPTWPHWWFDLCILPQHDDPPATATDRVIRTFGALNRVPENLPAKQARGLFLIGGPSKAHGWAAEQLTDAVAAVIESRPDLAWTLSDSRRTPAQFLEHLRRLRLKVEVFSHRQTPPDWVPTQLAAAEEAWATADSVSMIFEAVTAGARTGIMPVPVLKPRADPVTALCKLTGEGYATDYATWARNDRRLPRPKPLHETGRCADLVLAQLFPRA